MANKKSFQPKPFLSKASTKAIALFVLVALVIGGGIALYRHKLDAKRPQISDKINYSPPTKEEQAAGDKQKQADINAQKNPPPSSASVFISDATQYGDTVEVRAYVSNVTENGGTCTTTFTQGTRSFSVDTHAFMDASSTQCGAIDVARSKFATAGTWSVSVKYTSPSITGESEASSLTVN